MLTSRDLPKARVIGRGSTAAILDWGHGEVLKTHVSPSYHFQHPEFSIKCLQREREVYELLGKNPNILEYYGILPLPDDGGAPAIRLEKASNGDLRTMLNRRQHDTKIRYKWVAQLCSALLHLHNHSIIHCDLSCRNVLLNDNLDVKLADFGGSAIPGKKALVREETRSSLPRNSRTVDASIQTDIFAFGSAVYEIFTGHVPYADKGSSQIPALYDKKEWPNLEGVEAKGIILGCWEGKYSSMEALKTDLLLLDYTLVSWMSHGGVV